MDIRQSRTAQSAPAPLEKELDSDLSSGLTSFQHIQDTSPRPGATDDTALDGRIFLSEEEALYRTRQFPDEEQPIYLAYSSDDKDNPRNWPRWKKWYITCFVSMLNVLTYGFPYTTGMRRMI